MAPPAVTCARCGWQNEPTARMCGGCGQPLRSSLPGEGQPYTSTDTMPYSGEAETLYAPPAVPPDLPQSVVSRPPGGTASSPAWPEAGARSRAGSQATKGLRWWRAPLILLLVLGLLVGTSLGAWALIVRPIVHVQVDGALRGALDRAVDQAAAAMQNAPPVPSGEYHIDLADLNAAIQRELPTDMPLKNVALSFANGRARVSYTLLGRASFVYTTFFAASGRVMARNTTVFGALKLVETGPELQAAVNDAFARLPATLDVTEVRVANGALYVRVGP
jgi:hypothetical protein